MRKLVLILIVFSFPPLAIYGQSTDQLSASQLISQLEKSKADTNRISLQLKLGSYYLFKPGEFKNDLDSAINFFNQAAQLSNQLHEVDWQYKTLALIGNYYVEAGHLDSCKQCFTRVIAHYHQTGNKGKEADAWYRLGELLNNNNKFDHPEEMISCYQRARSLYTQNHDPLNAINCLRGIADVHSTDKQFDLAENELQQVLTQYKALGYKKLQYTYITLYYMQFQKGNYYRAMTYALEGIRSMKASGDTTLAEHFYDGMSRCNFEVKNYREALDWIHKAIVADKDVAAFDHPSMLIRILITLNRTEEARWALNDLSKRKATFTFWETVIVNRLYGLYYIKINKSDLALRYYRKVLESDLKQNLGEEFYNASYVLCNTEVADIYLEANQAGQAKKYLDNVALTIKNAKIPLEPRWLIIYYQNLYKYDLATGDYRTAVKNLERHDKIQDSLFNIDRDNKIAELNIQYQTAQRDKNLQLFKKQSQLDFQKAREGRNILIGSSAALLLLLGVGYNRYRLKQRNNRQLQAKQVEINQKNVELEELIGDKDGLLKEKDTLLSEKDWLLKEVHHRVKNNLQIVMSLLSTQSAYLENTAALTAITESRNRVQAISLIHQKLYGGSNVASIDMPSYVFDLVSYLRDGFDTSARRIRFEQMIEPVKVDIAQAVPLGLILNEAITNAIKYAFDEKGGQIVIALQEIGKEHLLMTIADDGKGLPADFNLKKSNSLGMEMMKALSKQLGGTFEIRNKHGVMVSIEFQIERVLHGNIEEGMYG